jgi:hypothetical protein
LGGATIGKIILYLYRKIKTFSRTSRPISIKLGTNHPWVKGILNCTNKGPCRLQRGDNHKNAKIWRGHFNFFFLENHSPRITRIYMNAFWHGSVLSLYKLWSPRVKVGDTGGETIFALESFKMNHLANFNWYKHFLHDGNSSLCKWWPSPLQRGDNHRSAKIGLGHLYIFFSWTKVPKNLRFIQVLPDIVKNQFY